MRCRDLTSLRLAFGTMVVMCSGCTGSLLETKLPVPTVYVLSASVATDAAATPLAVDLAVAAPMTAPGLDTERIAILRAERRLDYYRDAQWGAALPYVVQSLVVGSLQNQKLFRSVTSEQARVNATYLLELEVRDFQAEYANESSAPTVRVTLTGSLIRIADRKLIAILPASQTAAASANRLGAVVEGFESAARQAAVAIGKAAASAIASSASADNTRTDR
jgi:cholesterol transport system auxiliary component